MQLFDTTQVGLERALAGSAARQSAIATNLANVNTPGYVRGDVDFESALTAAFSRDDHDAAETASVTDVTDTSCEMRADGSNVDADAEAAAQAKNGLQYEAVSAAIKARTAILRAAIGVA